MYSIQPLVGPGAAGGASFGLGINAAGDVAGLSYASFPSPAGTRLILIETGTIWKSAALFFTQPWINANGSTLNSINAVGDAVGAHSTLNVTTEVGDFVRGGAVYDLVPMVGVGSMAVDINEAGLACGWSHSKAESFVYDTRAGGVVAWIEPLPGRSRAFALGINNSGQVVGTSDADGFLFSGGATHDLGAAAFVTRINDIGKVCGSVNKPAPDNYAPALCDCGVANPSFAEIPLPMGFDGGHAEGINIQGSVVGSCWKSGNMGSQQSAFIYSDGIATDLNALIPQDGWHLSDAYDINDAGQITGFGTYQGQTLGFLLTPVGLGVPSWPFIGRISLPELVGTIFGGVDRDGSGWMLVGGQRIPIGPWDPWRSLSPARRDALIALTLDKIAMFICDAGARESIRRTLIETAMGKLAAPAENAADGRRAGAGASPPADPVRPVSLSGLMREGKLRSSLRAAGRR